MPQGRLANQVIFATPTGKRPLGRPRTSWYNCITDLAWSRLGISLAELTHVAKDPKQFRELLDLLPTGEVEVGSKKSEILLQ